MKQRMKRSLLVGGAVATIGLGSLGTVGLAHAATNSTSSDNPQSSLIDKLVSTFNLNKADVQKVFDQEHTEREAKFEQQAKDRLAQLVKDGKLTQEQADKITAKAKELKAEREANKDAMQNKTEAERKTFMDQKRDELKKWLSDNGIDEQYGRFLMGGGRGPGGHGGMGMGMHRGADDSSSSSSSSTAN